MSQPVGRRGIADSWPKNERCTYCGNLFGEHPIQSGEQICHGQRLELPPSDDVKPYTVQDLDAAAPHIEKSIRAVEGLRLSMAAATFRKLLVTARAGLEDRERLRLAIVKIRAHTGRLPDASTELLSGLLDSVERIADEALGTARSGQSASVSEKASER